MANEALEARIRRGISRALTQWRLFNLSLAGKCRVLFGLAVLFIIAVALSMPWYRMERLIEERNAREAATLADEFLMYQVHVKYRGIDPQRARDRFTLDPHRPPAHVALIKLAGKPTTQPFAADKVLRRAIRLFATEPGHSEVFTTAWDDVSGRKVYRYVRAVRAHKGCLDCHEQAVAGEQYVNGQLVAAIDLTLPADPTDRQLLWNRAAIIAAVALATLCAILLFYLVTHWIILGPVDQLRQATEQVSGGDLDTRVNITTGDEFEQLAGAFNQMLAHLQESHQQLRTINKSLDTKLGELAETNVALYEANKLKSEFLANVSHELRTPLNSIIGFAELISGNEKIQADPKARRYVTNILNSSRALLVIINDLLDLAKIEAGKTELRLEKLSVGQLCNNLYDFIKPLADKKQLQVQLAVDGQLPTMYSDAGKIQQILYNLMSNAIKFTPEGGRITLRAEPCPPDQVRISVSDTGVGIPDDQKDRIFEKFLQIDGSVSREHGGVGLGLAIAKELTNMLGGTISVASEKGKGSTFSVVLPIELRKGTAKNPLPDLVR